MKITTLRTNHIKNPLGFALGRPTLSWIVEDTPDKHQRAARVVVALDAAFSQVVFDSGKTPGNEMDSLGYRPKLALAPKTRYFWRVSVWGETESATSEPAWFETAKMAEPWQAAWITPDFEDRQTHPYLIKNFSLNARVTHARAYICGLGLYHGELNGQKIGNEILTPHCNAYDRWIQYQTYDVTPLLKEGANHIVVMLGNGWYKGRYGLPDLARGVYGDQFALICEIHLTLENGKKRVILSDESWQAAPAPVLQSSIYDGETYDSRIKLPAHNSQKVFGVRRISLDRRKLQARRSLPVRINEEIKPTAVIHTPAGETVLDMGQNMVGWVRFKTRAPSGAKIRLQFGEVLQEGNFYRGNLRSAKAEYIYIADGTEAAAQPFFTFFGFRYVKVSGWDGEINPEDFTGCVVYSQMDLTGQIETPNPKLNRLFQNALWGQKGNFLDIPTDCPQRDERLGWTGDAQVFSGTACFNMDTYAFFAKFGYDLHQEQVKQNGRVPYVVPTANWPTGGSSAWGDAATIIPWKVYTFYGDPAILEQQYESMRAWVEYIKGEDDAQGSQRLWTTGFHFGDWLALDGNELNAPFGSTPVDFISSAFYYYSARLVARAARVLGKVEAAAQYGALADEVLAAIQKEFFTPAGRLAIHTQTGFVLTLFMDLAPEAYRRRIMADFEAKLAQDNFHLRTGFVGTPYLCRVLSNNGLNALAYRLLLNEDYPSWLYAVNLGATTIWERWNGIKPDGTFESEEMNSFNHYAYGAIVAWMYRDMCGLNPTSGDDQVTGFRQAHIAPKPDKRLGWAKATYRSAAGWYESGWQIKTDGSLRFEILIPFNARARVTLPDAQKGKILINGQPSPAGHQEQSSLILQLDAGRYRIKYHPTQSYLQTLSTYIPVKYILQNQTAKNALQQHIPAIATLTPAMIEAISEDSLRALAQTPHLDLSSEQLDQIDQLLRQFPLQS